MKISVAFARRFRWVNLPGAVLLALLQRTPAVRVAATAGEFVLASPVGAVLRAAVAGVAALGAVHSLAGATTMTVSSGTTSGTSATTGTALNSVAFGMLGTQTQPQSWRITGTIPPGLHFQDGANASLSLTTAGTLNTPSQVMVLAGTPTAAGTFNLTLQSFEFPNAQPEFSNIFSYTITVAQGVSTPPQITTQPASQTVNAGATVVFTVFATGSPTPTFQWRKDGATIPAATGATLTLSSVQTADAGGYSVVVTNGIGAPVTSNTATLTILTTSVVPNISTQPVSQTAALGQSVSFSVVATGTPAPGYQWFKNGVALTGEKNATLTIASVQTTDAGNYLVIVSNSAGSVNSNAATLTVNATQNLPVFATQPVSQTIAAGSSVVFSVVVNGAPAPTLQWRRNGVAISTATHPTLVVAKASAADAGTYTCVATNSVGAVTSDPATLAVSSTTDVGRLVNLSILTTISPTDPFFTIGTVLGGDSTTGSKPLLVRAVGPSLGQLGVSGAILDPKLEIFTSGNSSFASNDNWGGDPGLTNVFTQVGAFQFASPTSKDAAVYNATTPAGNYTVQVSGVAGATGTVIAELYDATPAASFKATTPRLIDVSVLKQLAAGATISAGFVIGGTTSKTVLIRAVGPGLGQLGVTGFMTDPHLGLFNGASAKIADNDNWGGDAALTAAMGATGAFAITDPASKDAMLLITLSPGNYTVLVDSANGGAGLVLVEVYDVP